MKFIQTLIFAAIFMVMVTAPKLGLAQSLANPEALPDFKVECSLGENHDQDEAYFAQVRAELKGLPEGFIDAIISSHRKALQFISAEQEIAIVRRAIQRTYPVLQNAKHPNVEETNYGARMKGIASKVVYYIDHDPFLTGMVVGYSAEDDPRYKSDDAQFYPEGTIKANLTEKFVQTAYLLEALGVDNSDVFEASLGFDKIVMSHELAHALDYHEDPVPDMAKNPEAVVNGLVVDQAVREGHDIKIGREHDAFFVHRSLGAPHAHVFDSAAAIIDQFAADNPEEAMKYSHLALTDPEKTAANRFRGSFMDTKMGRAFDASGDLLYYGQTVPVDIVQQLNTWHQSGYVPNEVLVRGLKELWAKYVTNNRFHGFLTLEPRPNFAYLRGVATKYEELIKHF